MIRYVGIDPSTKTGFVALDSSGQVLEAKQITAKGEDPERMSNLIQNILKEMQSNDMVCIEGFSFGSKGRALSIQYGLGWGIRIGLYQKGISYTEIAPTSLKKFTGAGGNAAKDEVRLAIYKRWGFENKSNDIVDAYGMAQVIRHLRIANLEITKLQQEVLDTILNKKPKEKKARKKA